MDNEREVLDTAVHFSFKYVNTNIEAGGVRVGKDKALNVPFICARHLISNYLLLADYTTQNAIIASAIKSVIKKEVTDENSELEAVYLAVLTTSAEVGTAVLNPRLRQLLVPLHLGEFDHYVSLTPLNSAGVSRCVLEVVDAQKIANESVKTSFFIRFSELGFGGANPQNAGALIRSMQKQIYTPAPQAQVDIKKLYRYYYQGVDLKVNVKSVLAWADWRDALSQNNQGSMPTQLAIREEESKKIKAICVAVLDFAAEVKEQLQENEHLLPREEGQTEVFLVAPILTAFERALLDDSLRDNDWYLLFAQKMARLIRDVLIKNNRISVSGLSSVIYKVVTA